jgi:hypothetical protein
VHAVAVTRVRGLHLPQQGYRDATRALEAASREDVVRVLAAVTGIDAADWRMRVGRPLPWVITMEPDAARATELVLELRRHGLGAVTCDANDARSWAPRGHATLVLGETALGFLEDPRRIPYDAVRATILATLDVETTTEQVERAAGSANPRNGQATMYVSSYRREGARSGALYLVLGPNETTVRIEQGAARLAGPDGQVGALRGTARERFQQCVDAIHERTPHAIHDARLLTARRGRSGFATRSDGITHTTSNVRETELVAYLLGRAWMERQIDPADETPP